MPFRPAERYDDIGGNDLFGIAFDGIPEEVACYEVTQEFVKSALQCHDPFVLNRSIGHRASVALGIDDIARLNIVSEN